MLYRFFCVKIRGVYVYDESRDSCTVFFLCLCGITAVGSISSSDPKWRGDRRPSWMAGLVRGLHESVMAIGNCWTPKTAWINCLVMPSTTNCYDRAARFDWLACKPHRARVKGSQTEPGWRPVRNWDRPSSSGQTCTSPGNNRLDYTPDTGPVRHHGAFLSLTMMAIRSFGSDKIVH